MCTPEATVVQNLAVGRAWCQASFTSARRDCIWVPLQTTRDYLTEGGSKLELIEFVTFLPSDYRVYLRTYKEIFQLPPIESAIS